MEVIKNVLIQKSAFIFYNKPFSDADDDTGDELMATNVREITVDPYTKRTMTDPVKHFKYFI